MSVSILELVLSSDVAASEVLCIEICVDNQCTTTLAYTYIRELRKNFPFPALFLLAASGASEK
jgi:hypothetical protein